MRPEAGFNGGSIPTAINMPCTDLVKEDGSLKSNEDIRLLMENAGVDPNGDRPIFLSCGGGVMTCVTDAALR